MSESNTCVPVSDRPYVKNHCGGFWACFKGKAFCPARNCSKTESYVGVRATCRVPKSLLVDVEGWLEVVQVHQDVQVKTKFDDTSRTDESLVKHFRTLSKLFNENKSGEQQNKTKTQHLCWYDDDVEDKDLKPLQGEDEEEHQDEDNEPHDDCKLSEAIADDIAACSDFGKDYKKACDDLDTALDDAKTKLKKKIKNVAAKFVKDHKNAHLDTQNAVKQLEEELEDVKKQLDEEKKKKKVSGDVPTPQQDVPPQKTLDELLNEFYELHKVSERRSCSALTPALHRTKPRKPAPRSPSRPPKPKKSLAGLRRSMWAGSRASAPGRGGGAGWF